jgi:hypothetical protein
MSILENWLTEVESWVGTPYVLSGCTKGIKGGSNCGHWFVEAILKTIPDSESISYTLKIAHSDYYKQNKDMFPEFMNLIAFQVEWDAIQPGDVAFPEIRRVAALPSVYFGDNVFVYCDASQKVIVKRALLGNLIDRVKFVYRFHKIAEEK